MTYYDVFPGTTWYNHGDYTTRNIVIVSAHRSKLTSRPTWWFIELSKWVITPVINGISKGKHPKVILLPMQELRKLSWHIIAPYMHVTRWMWFWHMSAASSWSSTDFLFMCAILVWNFKWSWCGKCHWLMWHGIFIVQWCSSYITACHIK